MSSGSAIRMNLFGRLARPRQRDRLLYAVLIAATVVLGLGSRKLGPWLPAFLAKEPGDALWALMVFLLVGFLFTRMSTGRAALLALTVSYLDEVSQIYHAPWIDSIRRTTLGGLVLGYGFRWEDIAAYTAGVTIGVVLELLLARS